MSIFKRILLPINGNNHAVEYAFDMAKKSNAKLFLLKTYRLLEEMKKIKAEDKSLKMSIEQKIEEDFEKHYKKILARYEVKPELLVEVGFLTDRIIATIDEKQIDILLLDGLNKGSDENLIERFEELKVPVLLIPRALQKTPI
ncbi:MAG: putative transcriptional regulator [Cyclobacteriaceae bacterium]|jgi:predicted transcriptional regulator